ncbi:MAG TPA: acyl-CoA dehydrogenase, partial [Steroidobacteraceae bacterium]
LAPRRRAAVARRQPESAKERSMDFALTDEQQLIVKSTRDFVRRELVPHEREVESSGVLREELWRPLKAKAIEAGLYAANMPSEVGGAGLEGVSWVLYEKELGYTSYALQYTCVARPSNILLACQGEQRERYLLPAVRGERVECLAMTEPQAGSDLRGMKTTAVRRGGDFIINGTKHFISHADHADFVILFAASGEEDAARGKRKLITAFLIDKGIPGFEVRPGYQNVSHRGYTNSILQFTDCRVPAAAVLGEVHRGFEVANTWLGATRLMVAANCLGRAERALECARQFAVDRVQFGQQIGKFQGVSFKLADMAVELRAAELLTLEAAWKLSHGTATDMDMAIAKLKSSEMLAMVADEALQIHGGMGLMSDLPLERIWRDARIERIWDGTSEVQRHIISRALLRPLGG